MAQHLVESADYFSECTIFCLVIACSIEQKTNLPRGFLAETVFVNCPFIKNRHLFTPGHGDEKICNLATQLLPLTVKLNPMAKYVKKISLNIPNNGHFTAFNLKLFKLFIYCLHPSNSTSLTLQLSMILGKKTLTADEIEDPGLDLPSTCQRLARAIIIVSHPDTHLGDNFICSTLESINFLLFLSHLKCLPFVLYFRFNSKV